jgi:hypothetical protein
MIQNPRQHFSSGSSYEPRIGFSRAVRIGNSISVAGTAPIAPDGTTVAPGDAAAQTRRCIEIIRASLEGLGANLSDVIRTRIFLREKNPRKPLWIAPRRPGGFLGGLSHPIIASLVTFSAERGGGVTCSRSCSWPRERSHPYSTERIMLFFRQHLLDRTSLCVGGEQRAQERSNGEAEPASQRSMRQK